MTDPSEWRKAHLDRKGRAEATVLEASPGSPQEIALRGKEPRRSTNAALDRLGTYLNELEIDILRAAQAEAEEDDSELLLRKHIDRAIASSQSKDRLLNWNSRQILASALSGAVVSQALTYDYWTTYPLPMKVLIFFLGMASAWVLVIGATRKSR